MARRIPDYPDAFAGFNFLASTGSWITVLSVFVFFIVVIDLFSTDTPFLGWKHELSNFKKSAHFSLIGQRSCFLVCLFGMQVNADSPENWQLLFQDPATPIIKGLIELHHDVIVVLIVTVILVLWVLIRTILQFNVKNQKLVTLPSIGHKEAVLLEIAWTFMPAILLVIIGLPSFALLYATDELIDPSMTLKVSGKQWFWSYQYSDYLTVNNLTNCKTDISFDSYLIPEEDLSIGTFRLLETDNRVILPTNVHIRVLVTASDVIHSWAIPSAGVKIDACPGRLNSINLFLDRPGVFYGQCSELCGINHGMMPITLEVIPYHQFVNWLFLKSHEE